MKLHENNDDWRWEQGPTFYGEDARKWAIEYGRAEQHLEELKALASFTAQRRDLRATLEELEHEN